MNCFEHDVLKHIYENGIQSQRVIAEGTGRSLGAVNRAVRVLTEEGMLNNDMTITGKALEMISERAPRNAVILAAGLDTNMHPLNTETPKALLSSNGEPIIERLIRQLNAVGVNDIYIVVGFMKERFEYLIDSYGVELVVNPDYAIRNNLHSLKLTLDHLSGTYIVPCDIWCASNQFSRTELHSWYMVNDKTDSGSGIRVNRRSELVAADGMDGCGMIGIAYLTPEDCTAVRDNIEKLCHDPSHDRSFWEEALWCDNKMLTPAKVVSSKDVVEINDIEQLKDPIAENGGLRKETFSIISQALEVPAESICDVSVLKKGMTNRSYIFSCAKGRFIIRIPGEGTERLIDRRHEAQVYSVIAGKGICDDPVYINSESGFKITRFVEKVRVCDPWRYDDLVRCMDKLRELHGMNLTVGHEFDIFDQIKYYISLRGGRRSLFGDHDKTLNSVFSLKSYIDSHAVEKTLTHIDAVPDNFLFSQDGSGGERLQLTDWEYAGMCDPDIDIAMFCIYSFYDRQAVDRLIDIYYRGSCPQETRTKIYCYIAAGGLLWSEWCEYKRMSGVEFGEYSLRQYRYAKEYSRIAKGLIENEQSK